MTDRERLVEIVTRVFDGFEGSTGSRAFRDLKKQAMQEATAEYMVQGLEGMRLGEALAPLEGVIAEFIETTRDVKNTEPDPEEPTHQGDGERAQDDAPKAVKALQKPERRKGFSRGLGVLFLGVILLGCAWAFTDLTPRDLIAKLGFGESTEALSQEFATHLKDTAGLIYPAGTGMSGRLSYVASIDPEKCQQFKLIERFQLRRSDGETCLRIGRFTPLNEILAVETAPSTSNWWHPAMMGDGPQVRGFFLKISALFGIGNSPDVEEGRCSEDFPESRPLTSAEMFEGGGRSLSDNLGIAFEKQADAQKAADLLNRVIRACGKQNG